MGGLDGIEKILADLEQGAEGDFLNDKASQLRLDEIDVEMQSEMPERERGLSIKSAVS